MALSVGVTDIGGANASPVTTAGVTTQATGSILVVGAIWETAAFTSITDSKSNSYTQIGTEQTIGGFKARLYYVENATGGSSHTFTLTTGGGNIFGTVLALEVIGGATASSLDQSNQQTDSASPFTSPSITTTNANDILVSACMSDGIANPMDFAESTGFTVNITRNSGASFYPMALGTRIVSSTGSYNSSWTTASGANAAVFIASFKELAGAGAAVKARFYQMLRSA